VILTELKLGTGSMLTAIYCQRSYWDALYTWLMSPEVPFLPLGSMQEKAANFPVRPQLAQNCAQARPELAGRIGLQ
jgi:hypothetical protein